MPTPAEWTFIFFVVLVIFLVHRLGRMGDALGALLRRSGKEDPPAKVEASTEAPPADAP